MSPGRRQGVSLKGFVASRGYPISLLPDVRSFKIQVKGWDWLAALFGVKRRHAPVLVFEPLGNKRINRYIVHQ